MASEELSKEAVVVAEGEEGIFWKAESIVDQRWRNGVLQYRVRWANFPPSEDTWEPCQNLCSSLYAEAIKLTPPPKPKKRRVSTGNSVNRRKRPSQKSLVDQISLEARSGHPNNLLREWRPSVHPAGAKVKTNHCWSTTKSQIRYREIERIHVRSPNASQRVAEARESGVAVCVVGHVGWAQFVARWVKNTPLHEPLDLSKYHEIDVDRMKHDIGKERVPVIRRNYNEYNPISAEITVDEYLDECWPEQSNLYLHQWQFPLSFSVREKLCRMCEPMPDDVLGEDLLQFWMDDLDDNPFQYIFMGGKETMSKLHKDDGGLMITIAPIVGKKEVVLVHRADGPNCLYNLDADLTKPDLHHFPKMAFARVWKSIIEPGEILIMPQGTYHQCRNVTPCLSYSRFVLDTTNVNQFLDSAIRGEAKSNIDHEVILWNAITALEQRVSDYLSETHEPSKLRTVVPSTVWTAVENLHCLRHIARSVRTHLTEAGDEWKSIVQDIDQILHNFEHRNAQVIPPLVHPPDKIVTRKARHGVTVSECSRLPCVSLDDVLKSAETVDVWERGAVLPDSVQLSSGDSVSIRVGDRIVPACVHGSRDLTAVLLSFENAFRQAQEYVPISSVRVPVVGDQSVGLSESELAVGMRCLECCEGEDYEARVESWRSGTFYRVQLIHLDHAKSVMLWVPRESIVEKLQVESCSQRGTTSFVEELQVYQKDEALEIIPEHVSLQPTAIDGPITCEQVKHAEESLTDHDSSAAASSEGPRSEDSAVAPDGHVSLPENGPDCYYGSGPNQSELATQ